MFKNKVGRPSNEVIKKRRILNIVLIAIIFVVLFSLTYMLTNITTNRLKGGAPTYYGISCEEQTACYQAGFRNGNLYQRVIDSYNDENNASLSYEDVITDEQFLAITRVYADEGSIDDATGIEKLVNLEKLSLDNNNLTSIDVSSLTNLEFLNIKDNRLNQINLGTLHYLTELHLSDNNLTFVDLSGLENLEELELSSNRLVELDISNNPALEYLDIVVTNISGVDFSNNPNLKELYIDYSAFSSSNININQLDRIVIPSVFITKYENLNLYDEFRITSDISSNMEIINDDDTQDNIISVDNNIVIANNTGLAYLYYGEQIIIEFAVSDAIESNKYNINYEERYLYTEIDNNEEIMNNLYYTHEFLDILGVDEYNMNISNNQLNISITDEDGTQYGVSEYTLGRIDLSGYEVNEKEITVNGEFNYEEVPHDNVTLEYSDNTLIVKDLNGNEVDRYTVVSNNDPGTIDPEPIDQDDNNGDPAPNNNDNNTTSSKKTTLNKFENNAKTYDDIIKYFVIGGIAIVLIIGVIIYTKKK